LKKIKIFQWLRFDKLYNIYTGTTNVCHLSELQCCLPVMFVNKNKIKGCGLSAMSDISHGINQWYDRDDSD